MTHSFSQPLRQLRGVRGHFREERVVELNVVDDRVRLYLSLGLVNLDLCTRRDWYLADAHGNLGDTNF